MQACAVTFQRNDPNRCGSATPRESRTGRCRKARETGILRRVLYLGLALSASPCFAAGLAENRPPIATETRTVTVVDGDDIAFRRADNAEKFSQSRVGQIAQDGKGFMWFGTQYGLYRFDGYDHVAFAPDARTTSPLSGVFVHAMLSDSVGRLWIASDRSLDILDPNSGAATRIAYAGDSPSSVVQSIYEDATGTFWLGTTTGLYGLDAQGRTRVHFRHDPDDPASLGSSDVKFAQQDRGGALWVANGAGLEAVDPSSGRVQRRVPLRESREIGFVEDRDGLFWIYHASGNALATFDRTTGAFVSYRFVDGAGKPLPRFGIYTALLDRDGGLWFGTGGAGLLRFDAQARRFVRYANSAGDPRSLGGDDVVTLFQDKDDNIWVALHGMPINLFPARAPPFRKLPSRPGDSRGRTEGMVNAVLEVDGRSLWVSFAGLLMAVDLQTGERTNLRETLQLNADVISMAQDGRGRVWLGTTGGGAAVVESSRKVRWFRHDPDDPASIADDVVNDILVDGTGRIWLATWGGLCRFDERRGAFENYRPPGTDPKYLALAEDSRHDLWLATHVDGLQRFDPGRGEFFTYPAGGVAGTLSNGRVNAVHVSRRGIVWAGTQNGLDALDPATGIVRNFRSGDGLPGNAVSCILEDDRDGIWLGTNNGISRLETATGEFLNFTQADGLPGLDFTGWGSCQRTRADEMYFAGFAGATGFNPDRVHARRPAPSVEFTDLVIAGHSYPEGPSESRPPILPDIRNLDLPYSRNNFSVGFAALHYANPTASRYRFRLTGLEEQWHSAGSNRRVASFNSLTPGDYRLEVQAAAGGSPWSTPKTLEFTILKPWWLTTEFRVTAGIVFLGLAWLAYRARVRHTARRFDMRLEERVAERTRIARDLHDSLLQGFHGLMFRLQAVRNLLPARPIEAARSLDDVLSHGDETVEEARIAVTGLRSSASAETDLESALRVMVRAIPLPGNATAPDFRIVVEGEPRRMIPLVQDEVLQIAREAFRNAAHHAQAKVVHVDVGWGAAFFSLKVRDDGVGLDERFIAQGRHGRWGLQGMRERTRQVGGSLEIRSEGDAGTSVELSIAASRAYARAARVGRDRTRTP